MYHYTDTQKLVKTCSDQLATPPHWADMYSIAGDSIKCVTVSTSIGTGLYDTKSFSDFYYAGLMLIRCCTLCVTKWDTLHMYKSSVLFNHYNQPLNRREAGCWLWCGARWKVAKSSSVFCNSSSLVHPMKKDQSPCSIQHNRPAFAKLNVTNYRLWVLCHR